MYVGICWSVGVCVIQMSCCYPAEDAEGSDYINKTGRLPMPRIDSKSLKYHVDTLQTDTYVLKHTRQRLSHLIIVQFSLEETIQTDLY